MDMAVFQMNVIYKTGQGQIWPRDRSLLTPGLDYCFICPRVNRISLIDEVLGCQ